MPSAWLSQVEAIFFEASGRSLAPGAERDAFRERWLGRYLDQPRDTTLIAVMGESVAGYLVGTLDNPANTDRFVDLAYYRCQFRPYCDRFPAHLHINLARPFRNRGIGQQLIDTFAARAAGAGATGVHVVTGKGMRNVRFYERCGFAEIGLAAFHGREVVFLGRALASPPSSAIER
jgi:GNAT superfamily N-acetyltransferase